MKPPSRNNANPAFVILGPPGSGKGTQGKILGNIPRFVHFACGDLVPDELTIGLWKAQIDNLAGTHLYKPDIDFLILDGIPRNVQQARLLDQYVQVHQVFHLSCPNRDELARRMRKRALKENRLDDANDTVINQRIATYEAETKPILQYYPADHVTVIDATQPPVKVLSEVIQRIIQLPIYQNKSGQIV